MSDRSMADSPVNQDGDLLPTKRAEMKLIKNSRREGEIPSDFKFVEYIPADVRRGFRYKSFYFEGTWRRASIKEFYYRLWIRHPWIKAFIRKIANFCMSVGWFVKYEGEGEADPKVTKSITDFFNYPNDYESFPDILWMTIVQLKLWNESFWEMCKTKEGIPIDFYILNGVVAPRVDEHGNPLSPAFVQRVLGDTEDFEYDEVVWFKVNDPIGRLAPSSDLECLELTVMLDVYAMQLNRQSFLKAVRTTKAFMFSQEVSEEQMVRNQQTIENIHQGIVGAFNPFIALQGECKIEDLKSEDTKMEAKDLREYCRDEMSAVLGVPIAKMGIKGTQIKEGDFINKTFYNEEIKPLLLNIEGTINRYLDLVGVKDYRFKFKDYPIRDLKETARLIDVARRRGFASTNEIRRWIGLPPMLKGGNEIFMEGKNGEIIFVDDIREEAKRISEKAKEERNQSSFPFSVGTRKVSRRGTEFPYDDSEDEEELEDEEIEEEVEQDPF